MPRKKVEVVDETKNIALALKNLCEDKGLPTSVVIDAMSEALKKAYFKFSDDYPDTIIKVDIDLDTGNIQMSKIKNVVEEIQDADAIAPIQYAIINKFKEGQTELNEFEAGKIYQVKNLTLNGDNIQVDEAGNELAYGLTAIVEQAKWSVVETTGSWAQGQ